MLYIVLIGKIYISRAQDFYIFFCHIFFDNLYPFISFVVFFFFLVILLYCGVLFPFLFIYYYYYYYYYYYTFFFFFGKCGLGSALLLLLLFYLFFFGKMWVGFAYPWYMEETILGDHFLKIIVLRLHFFIWFISMSFLQFFFLRFDYAK